MTFIDDTNKKISSKIPKGVKISNLFLKRYQLPFYGKIDLITESKSGSIFNFKSKILYVLDNIFEIFDKNPKFFIENKFEIKNPTFSYYSRFNNEIFRDQRSFYFQYENLEEGKKLLESLVGEVDLFYFYKNNIEKFSEIQEIIKNRGSYINNGSSFKPISYNLIEPVVSYLNGLERIFFISNALSENKKNNLEAINRINLRFNINKKKYSQLLEDFEEKYDQLKKIIV